MLKFSVEVEKPKKDVRRVACSKCNITTNHKVLTSVLERWNEEEYDVQGKDCYEIICCLGCETLSFRKESSNSEDYDIDDDGIVYLETEEIYPNRIIGRPPLNEQYYLPDKVKNIYKETHAALASKLKILAGVGIRGLVEAVCTEEKANGANLKERIDDLVIKGILTASNAETLHKTRFLGNKSAHELEIAKDQELGIAFDIVENMLQTLYIIPKKAHSLGKQEIGTGTV